MFTRASLEITLFDETDVIQTSTPLTEVVPPAPPTEVLPPERVKKEKQ